CCETLAGLAPLAGHAVADGRRADPTFVGGFAGELVTRAAREPGKGGGIVQTRVDGAHPEAKDVARLVIGRQPAPAKLLAQGHRVAGQPSIPILPDLSTGLDV